MRSSAIHLTTVANTDNQNLEYVFLDLIHDPVVADPDSVDGILTSHCDAVGWPRNLGQEVDVLGDHWDGARRHLG